MASGKEETDLVSGEISAPKRRVSLLPSSEKTVQIKSSIKRESCCDGIKGAGFVDLIPI